MSSNFSKYGAIDDGKYTVNYVNPGKTGKLKSNWAINDRKAVNSLDGVNPSPIDPYSSTQKDGIFIHRSNNDGSAGGVISTGCLLIVPTKYVDNKPINIGWDQFNTQLQGVRSFQLILTGRKK